MPGQISDPNSDLDSDLKSLGHLEKAEKVGELDPRRLRMVDGT